MEKDTNNTTDEGMRVYRVKVEMVVGLINYQVDSTSESWGKLEDSVLEHIANTVDGVAPDLPFCQVDIAASTIRRMVELEEVGS